ncbi:MAG: ABC transporter substrate-binding protein, partial [Myxococcota bacterium]|nr:ABC transporter substrate-binding protein [Myxococcota bacterium]
MSGRERRLAAIFFSDMKGFSSQMDADEEGTLDRLDRHNAVMRSQIEAHGGRVIKTVGDAFMAEFTSSVAAVKCALDCLRDFDGHNADVSDEDAIHVRIGVHVGDVVVEGDDLFGEAVNVAARLEPQAPVGGVCISQAVYAQVRRKVHARGEVRGEVALKGIGEPMRLYALWPSAEHLDVPEHAAPAVARSNQGRLLAIAGLGVLAAVLALGIALWPPADTAEAPARPAEPAEPVASEVTPSQTPSPSADSEVRRGGTLRVGWRGGWGGFSPAKGTVDVSEIALDMILENLIRLDASGQAEPVVLEHATVSEDGLTLTLKLRPDVVFHAHPCLEGGEARPATAADVIASIELQETDLDPLPVDGLQDFRDKKTPHISGIRATETGEVTIALTHRVPYVAQSLQRCQLVPVEYEPTKCDLPPPGTGPFVVTGPLQGSTLRMRRAVDYWGTPPRLDAIELTALEDEVGALSRMMRGELDLLGVAKSRLIADLRAEMPVLAPRFGDLDVTVAPWVRKNMTATASVMFIGVEGPWSSRPALRRALAYALDREALMAQVEQVQSDRRRALTALERARRGAVAATLGGTFPTVAGRS